MVGIRERSKIGVAGPLFAVVKTPELVLGASLSGPGM